MTDGDLETGGGGQGGEFGLPQPGAVAVGSAAVGADQQLGGVRVQGRSDLLPPAADGVHRKRGGVVIGADRHPAGVGGDVVDAQGHVRHGPGDLPATAGDRLSPRRRVGWPYWTVNVAQAVGYGELCRRARARRYSRGAHRGRRLWSGADSYPMMNAGPQGGRATM